MAGLSTTSRSPISQCRAYSLKRVKLAYFGDIGIKIPQKLPALKIVTARIDDEFAPPLAAIASIAAIDIAARLRRHAAPVRG
jgi:hypothetical protein